MGHRLHHTTSRHEPTRLNVYKAEGFQRDWLQDPTWGQLSQCPTLPVCLDLSYNGDSKPPTSSAAEPTLVQRLTVVFAYLPRSQLSANSSSAAQQSNRSQGAPRGASSGRADFAIVSQVETSPFSKNTTDDASQRGWSRLHDDPPPYRG